MENGEISLWDHPDGLHAPTITNISFAIYSTVTARAHTKTARKIQGPSENIYASTGSFWGKWMDVYAIAWPLFTDRCSHFR